MQYPMITMSKFDLFRANVYQHLKRPYLVTGIVSYAVLTIMVLAYLAKEPRYTSQMELVLPGTGSSSSVTLDNVGQVVSQTNAPYSGGGFNPRVNYKEMLSSRGVRERAAEQLNMTVDEFGKSKIKLTEQTSIITLSTNHNSPKVAQAKAQSLYESLQTELDNLREDEVARRDQSIKHVLNQYRERMNITRSAIVDFQQRSMLVSSDQMQQLIKTLSGVKERRVYLSADIQKLEQYINHLSEELGVSPKLAGQAFALQSDVEFRAYIVELQTSITQLSEYSSRWGINHPKVIAQQKRLDFTRTSINKRTKEIFGIEVNEVFKTLNFDLRPKHSQLFADLIEAYASQQGQHAMLIELDRSENHLSDQLKIHSREVVELERLQREFSMAEAIFTSAAGRLEASKSDIFASYPVVQMLTPPSSPNKSSSPSNLIAAAAAIVGFVFITFGLFTLCHRKYLIQALLKKS